MGETSTPSDPQKQQGPKGKVHPTPGLISAGLETQLQGATNKKIFIRRVWQQDSTLSDAHAQFRRVSNDLACNETDMNTNYFNTLNPIEKAFCIKAVNGNYKRICYLCGVEIWGKKNIRGAWVGQGGTPQTAHNAAAYPEVEHISPMKYAAPYGQLSTKLNILNNKNQIKHFFRSQY